MYKLFMDKKKKKKPFKNYIILTIGIYKSEDSK